MSELKLLTNDSLTSGEVEGRGLFEDLMRSIQAQLAVEYNAKRITGSEYAKVLSELMAAAMANANQYAVSMLQANQQARLIEEQINTAKTEGLIALENLEKVKAETELVQEQVLLTREQVKLAKQELLNQVTQGELLAEQVIGASKDNDIKDAQETQLTSQTALIDQQVANASVENSLLTQQVAKTTAETGVLNQKKITEEYQTKDLVNGEPVGGIVGAQKKLYTNQSEGYIRDAEQKAAKIFMDSFNTRSSTDSLAENETIDATVTGIQIRDVLNVVRAGVGVSNQ